MLMFDKEVLKPFIESINNYGTHNAFCINERFYTYKELAETISKIRITLQREKIAGKNIGLVANDDIETYASIFAIWLEGAAYVPLHPKEPTERSLGTIHQAKVSLLLNSDTNLKFPSIKTIDSKNLKTGMVNIQPKTVSDDLLAYILFTSGSTGKPKGVPVTRKNISAFMKAFWETGIKIDENDRCLQCFDLTFDVSVQSYLVSLTKGACTYTIPYDQIKFSYVYSLLEDQHITFGAMAPSMIRYLQPYFDEINFPSMRYNLLVAEASPVDLIVKWSKCIPNAEIINFYGPTEITVYCTYHKFYPKSSNKQYNGIMSIGKAMSGLDVIITDDELKISERKQKGELCVSGIQVTSGYLNDPGLNKKVFFTDKHGRRFYRTGDICFRDSDDDIMYCGRIDSQVKIQGFRVELGEIEFHARENLQGQNAVAVAFENTSGNSEIALFVEGELCDRQSLLKQLKLRMPHYMLPTKIICLSKFPLNPNSKTDRIALKKLIPS
jgi:D-alanine--poly(phosphoribitol) ligase subunit 1